MASGLVEKKSCNVLIVGKSGAGKTSLATALLEGKIKFDEEIDEKVFSSSTKKCLCKTVDYPIEDEVQITLKIIDTVGLFDTDKANPKAANDVSIEVMKKFVASKIPEGVSLVIFVMKKGRYTPEEKATFEFIIRKFEKDISRISALCITNTELERDETREELIKEFRQDPKTKNIASFMKKGIYTVGFPSQKNTLEALWPIIEPNITRDRATLRALMKESCELHLANAFTEPHWWDKCKIV